MLKHMSKLSAIFEKVLYWAVLTLILFIPLFMKFPLFGVSGTFVSIRSEDILIALVYVIWAIYLIVSGKIKTFFKDKLNLAFVVFFAVGLVSLFSAAYVTYTVGLKLGLFHLLRRVELLMLLPMVASIIKSKRQAYFYLFALSLVVFIANFYAIGQRYLSFPAVSTTTSELSKGVVYYIQPYDRIISTFGGHYDLAVFLVMFLSIASATVIYTLKKKLVLGIWLSVLAAVSAVILVMTAARLSFFAAIFGIIAGLILSGNKKFILAILILAGIGMAFPSQLRDRLMSTFTVNIQKSWSGYFSNKDAASGRSKLNIPTLPTTWTQIGREDASKSGEVEVGVSADIVPGEPVDATDLGVYRSFDIRVRVEWPRAIRSFVKNPLLGTGYSSLGLATDNDFLRSLGEVGLLGTIAFIFVLYEAIRRIVKIFKETTGFAKYLAAGVLAMIIAFVINALFIDVFEASKTASLFWIILGIMLGLYNVEYGNTKNTKN
jgi:hypothetical protein